MDIKFKLRPDDKEQVDILLEKNLEEI